MNLSGMLCPVVAGLLLAGCAAGSGPAQPSRAGSSSAATSDPDSGKPTGTASSAACTEKPVPRPTVARQLPAGFLTVAGWIPTEVLAQGQTKAVRGVVAGEVEDLVTVRDAAVSRISAAGYRKTGSDQEPGYEAEAGFTGPQEGDINVRPGCPGYLVLTYTIRF